MIEENKKRDAETILRLIRVGSSCDLQSWEAVPDGVIRSQEIGGGTLRAQAWTPSGNLRLAGVRSLWKCYSQAGAQTPEGTDGYWVL